MFSRKSITLFPVTGCREVGMVAGDHTALDNVPDPATALLICAELLLVTIMFGLFHTDTLMSRSAKMPNRRFPLASGGASLIEVRF
jgi:hypothetical protein